MRVMTLINQKETALDEPRVADDLLDAAPQVSARHFAEHKEEATVGRTAARASRPHAARSKSCAGSPAMRSPPLVATTS